jgi:uncharacterized membrane protein
MHRALSMITPTREDVDDLRSAEGPANSPSGSSRSFSSNSSFRRPQNQQQNNVSFGMIVNHYSGYSDGYISVFMLFILAIIFFFNIEMMKLLMTTIV